MTFTDIVTRVTNKLNRTSTDAITRIGLSVNDRYRAVVSSVGINTAKRTSVTANTVVGDRTVAFTCEKVYAVSDPAYTPARLLFERTYDELKYGLLGTDPPRLWAVQTEIATTVTIFLDCTPATIYALNADALVSAADLTGTNVPAFAADFHDVLYWGALADELEHMEKYDKAAKQEKKYELRLAELRYFLAKSAYKTLYQGKTNPMGAGVARLN